MNHSKRTDMRLEPLGDRALVARLTEGGASGNPVAMAAAADRVRNAGWEWIVDVVSAFDTVTIVYDPVILAGMMTEAERAALSPYAQAFALISGLLKRTDEQPSGQSRIVDIPICYGGAYGPDLQEAAERAGMSAALFAERHASARYTVAMIGFMPGFPYLTGLPRELQQPRKLSPRSRVPAGSVGIAGVQTGVYPFSSPGGWQLIGRTPAVLFDARREQPSLLQAGDEVRFIPIDSKQLEAWGERQ